jgi:hypothetical protein
VSPSPPDGLVENLRRLDPDLRLRWATHQQVWLVELQVKERQPSYLAEKPSAVGTTPRALYWWDSWRLGRIFVTKFTHPIRFPWEFLAAHLKHLSLEAHHAKDALLERLDEVERQEEVAAKRKWDVGNEAAAKTLFDDWGWEQKRKISTFVPGENPHVTSCDGFVVYDRRRYADRGANAQ